MKVSNIKDIDKFQKQLFIFHEFFIYYHAYSAILSNK